MKSLSLLIGISFGVFFTFGINLTFQSNRAIVPVFAQTLRPEMVAAEVYRRLSQLPQENKYIVKETGQIDADNTLVSRFIRYHQYVKNRPVNYRLDWKLTLADYLGVNEPIQSSRYPGSQTLKVNPQESDSSIINKLTRTQRNELIDTLVSIYNSQTPSANTSNSSSSSSPTNSTPQPRLPQPGDAQLLLP
jgi:hypothetical protein